MCLLARVAELADLLRASPFLDLGLQYVSTAMLEVARFSGGEGGLPQLLSSRRFLLGVASPAFLLNGLDLDLAHGLTFPVFTHYGVGLWVPEVGGAVDPGSEAHDLVMNLHGGMSKGERTRIKTRVRTAMAAQAAIEGRFLGGRPPYGYQLVDIGPHPNPGKAAVGQRLHQLAPDPISAPVVQRIFAEFLEGAGLHAIASGTHTRRHPLPFRA